MLNFMSFGENIGIDLGTATVLVYIKGRFFQVLVLFSFLQPLEKLSIWRGLLLMRISDLLLV